MKVEEPISDYNQLDLSKEYTYFDYFKWRFSERVELIYGKIVKMSPGPNTKHQSASSQISRIILNHFHNHPCKVFIAPFDVRLPIPKKKADSTVVQPDIFVLCDLSKLDENGCKGAPDLVIEILSPGNSKHDLKTKFELYELAGVREYWIVDPINESILVYVLKNNQYIGLKPVSIDDNVKSEIFPELNFALNGI
ncbi:MAG: Uma2 family endonuclease, partial [Candidatus Paceibacterota bacterium]